MSGLPPSAGQHMTWPDRRYVGLARQTHTGVTSLDMSAGTGKLKKVSAARAGVPRAPTTGPADYDAAAALGIKQQVCAWGACESPSTCTLAETRYVAA